MRNVRKLHEENYKIFLKYIKYDLNDSKYYFYVRQFNIF